MSEFHIGDRVCVLYQGKKVGGIVDDIRRNARVQLPNSVYRVAGTYWPEEMLDYALDDAQEEFERKAGTRVYAFSLAVEELRGIVTEAKALSMPPSFMAWLNAEIAEGWGRWKP